MVVVERIGAIICNVVVVLANVGQNLFDKLLRQIRDRALINLQEKLVEER